MSGLRHSLRGDVTTRIVSGDDARHGDGEALDGGGGEVHPEAHYENEIAVPYASSHAARVHGQSPSAAAAPFPSSSRIHASQSPLCGPCDQIPARA